jgi:hypothetical protein
VIVGTLTSYYNLFVNNLPAPELTMQYQEHDVLFSSIPNQSRQTERITDGFLVTGPVVALQGNVHSKIGRPSNVSSSFLNHAHEMKQTHEKATVSTTNNIVNTRRYCAWGETLSECQSVFAPSLKSKPQWFFLGDSNMWLMYDRLRKRKVKTGWKQTKRQHGRCNHTEYYGLENPAVWVYPDHSKGEGPVGCCGKPMIPHCSDLHWAFNMRIEKKARMMEFLVVEFARDVETQTASTKTTQETVAKYLQQNYETKKTVCVANTMLHDIAIPGISLEVFISNLNDYIGLLERSCGIVIWVSTISSRDLEEYQQRIARLQKWNEAVIAMLNKSYPDVLILDVWQKTVSMGWNGHADNMHMTTDYYLELAKFFDSFKG